MQRATKTIIKDGSVTVEYSIRQFENEDNYGNGPTFDWVTSAGGESTEWFESVEDAIRDVETYYQ